MKKHEIRELLFKLKRLVRNNKFYAVPRGKDKSPAKSFVIKLVVSNLTIDDFSKKEHDRNGSGEYVFVFITRNGQAYYIKFKFVIEEEVELVRFISFHHPRY